MADLVLGPVLRHVDQDSATVWVETSAPCEVRIASGSARTFTVNGHHYALVAITGLPPDTVIEYQVHLDDAPVWPLPDSDLPPSRIRTRPATDDTEFLMIFGSCRKPESADEKERAGLGVDALAAYAVRMAGQDEDDWPDSLMLLGDQVYADETSKATQEWLATRRDLDQPPGVEVTNFEEYARLYHEAWSSRLVRWLLSTVPTSMIFDDHDVRDDWNTSQAWREEMAATPWWRERIRGGLASYWIYQHIGNLGPTELAEDETYAAVLAADGDAGEILRDFADEADAEVNGGKSTRWSYRRDFGSVRLLVIDTRSGRILEGGARSMVSDAEFDWIEDNTDGEYDHLLIGSSLPWLMPPVISHLQSLNEVACRRGGWRGRLAERIRQGADLEHWPSFRASSERLARLIKRVATGSPATICVLSGDVHHVYAAEATFTGTVRSRVYQLTCSPVHNSVPPYMPFAFRVAWWRPLAAVIRWWAFRHVDPLPVDWRKVSGPYFENSLATLTVTGRQAAMTVLRAAGTPDDPRLMATEPLPLTG